MVLGAINSPAGVSGLAAQKVTFFDKPECGPKSYMSGDKSRAAAAKALLKAQLGRKADWIISSAYLESIALPSKKQLEDAGRHIWHHAHSRQSTVFANGRWPLRS